MKDFDKTYAPAFYNSFESSDKENILILNTPVFSVVMLFEQSAPPNIIS